jgi:hypothetical protein
LQSIEKICKFQVLTKGASASSVVELTPGHNS